MPSTSAGSHNRSSDAGPGDAVPDGAGRHLQRDRAEQERGHGDRQQGEQPHRLVGGPTGPPAGDDGERAGEQHAHGEPRDAEHQAGRDPVGDLHQHGPPGAVRGAPVAARHPAEPARVLLGQRPVQAELHEPLGADAVLVGLAERHPARLAQLHVGGIPGGAAHQREDGRRGDEQHHRGRGDGPHDPVHHVSPSACIRAARGSRTAAGAGRSRRPGRTPRWPAVGDAPGSTGRSRRAAR